MKDYIEILKRYMKDYQAEINKKERALIHQCHKYVSDIRFRSSVLNKRLEEWENNVNFLEEKVDIMENIKNPEDRIFLETPIENAKFSTHIFNALLEAGILTLKDIFMLSPSVIKSFRQVGEGAIEEINKKFLSRGIKWK